MLAEGVLTDEHAPPKVLGGAVVALTCVDCNHAAGRLLDPHAATKERGLNFLASSVPTPERVRLALPDGPVRSRMAVNGLAVTLEISDESLPRVAGELNKVGGIDIPLELATTNKTNAAGASLLRSAYIIAFAIFGYRYILDNRLTSVREQLARPNDGLIRIFSAEGAKPSRQFQVVLVDEPEALRSLAIQMGRYMVYLPALDGGTDLYDRLLHWRDAGGSFVPTWGQHLPWPAEPMHLLDFQ